MTDYDLLRYDIMAKVPECIKQGYPKDLYNAIITSIIDIIKIAKSEGAKQSWQQFAVGLKEKRDTYLAQRKAAKEALATTTEEVYTGESVQTGDTYRGESTGGSYRSRDFDATYPLQKASDGKPSGVTDTTMLVNNCKAVYRDNAYLVLGPYSDDLRMLIADYAYETGRDMRYIDLSQLDAGSMPAVFDWICTHYCDRKEGGALALANIATLRNMSEDVQQFVCTTIKQLRQGDNVDRLQVFLLSTDPTFYFNDMFRRFFAADQTMFDPLSDDSSSRTLGEMRIPLPSFRKVRSYFCQRFELDDTDEEAMTYIRKNAYSLGYCGLMSAMSCTPDNWKETLSQLKTQRKDSFDEYVSRLGRNNLGNLLDDEWQYKPTGKKAATIATANIQVEQNYDLPQRFDLDVMDGEGKIKRNVVRLMNLEHDNMGNPVSVTARCGLVVQYALSGGDSMRNLQNLSEQEAGSVLTERWNIAYAALSQLMQIPHGELVFDIGENEGLDGQCCNAGQRIRMHKKFISKTDPDELYSGCNTMLHELYHAVQYAATEAKRRGDDTARAYFYRHFHITVERINAWEHNNATYHASTAKLVEDDTQNFNLYYNQVMEADARIFAADALDEMETVQYAIED